MTLFVKVPASPNSFSLRTKSDFLYHESGTYVGRRSISCRLIDSDGAPRVDDAGSEGDRREVPFARGSQAEHKATPSPPAIPTDPGARRWMG